MKIRLSIMLVLYNKSQKIYTQLFKQHKRAWNISKEDFLNFPKGSLGHHLGVFYQEKDFDVVPKLENHDVFHLITESGTDIQDEVAMQYLLLGKGQPLSICDDRNWYIPLPRTLQHVPKSFIKR